MAKSQMKICVIAVSKRERLQRIKLKPEAFCELSDCAAWLADHHRNQESTKTIFLLLLTVYVASFIWLRVSISCLGLKFLYIHIYTIHIYNLLISVIHSLSRHRPELRLMLSWSAFAMDILMTEVQLNYRFEMLWALEWSQLNIKCAKLEISKESSRDTQGNEKMKHIKWQKEKNCMKKWIAYWTSENRLDLKS